MRYKVLRRDIVIGSVLNHYRITKAVGGGGMGEVYEAEDTKLHRHIALKVLATGVADDPERRLRFEREARAIAALNHPNIVTIYSIEDAGSRLFLTMELVRGQTLSRLIRPGGLRLPQLLQLAIPLTEAVSAAHRQGVIHRDLKPDNIMVSGDGHVKVLDFGLAQLKEVSREDDGVTISRAQQLTGDGRVMGTVAYMSPEQAQGMEVDARSDIFSLGIVLFEMVTGERPFKGDNAISTLSSIVRDPAPSIVAVNPTQPEELARIVRRSLAKDVSRRYQTAIDVRNDLEDLRLELESGRTSSAAPAPHRSNRLRETIAWGVAATMLIAALIAVFSRPTIEDPPSEIFSVLPPEKTTLTEGEAPQVSPDGKTIAFVATDDSGRTRLYVRDRGTLEARALTESDDATMPFWSPDSWSIGFFAGGRLKRIAISGGRPQTLATAPVPRGGTWSRDDVIVFVPFPEQPPHRISAAGGSATPLPIESDVLRWLPAFLPDGRHYLYLATGRGHSTSPGIFVGAIDRPDATLLVSSNTSATYVDPGYLVFRRESSLAAQRLNVGTLRLEGSPAIVADEVSFNPITQQTMFSASRDGVLAYLGAGQIWQLTWFDRLGRRLTSPGSIRGYNSLCLAADGKHVVYDLADTTSGNVDLWSMDVTSGTTTRLTFHPAADFYVACSPTTDDIVFSSPRNGTPTPFRLALSSPGGELAMGESSLPMLPSQWSRDGRFLLFSAFSEKTDFDVWILPLTGGKPFSVVATEAVEKGGQLSANGRWIAYASGQGGNYEVYVQPFPPTGAIWQVSRNGGRQPQWRPDGRQLFYISADKKLIAVDVDSSAAQFVVGASRVLIDTRVGGWERTHLGNPYAISADGERLLVANAADETLPVTVMLNWPSLMVDPRR